MGMAAARQHLRKDRFEDAAMIQSWLADRQKILQRALPGNASTGWRRPVTMARSPCIRRTPS
jgi:hypothetical protein